MKLYEITNDYIGESYVRCLVIAENDEQAIELARPKFKQDARGRDSYWQELEVEVLCTDVNQPWVGEVTDA